MASHRLPGTRIAFHLPGFGLVARSILALLCATGCAVAPAPSRVVYEDADRFVRLEVTGASTNSRRDHPATVLPAQLARILRGLHAEPRAISPQSPLGYAAPPTKSEHARAFDDETAAFLAQALSAALKKATPLEDVVFFMELTPGDRILEITSGGAYVREKELHVLLANYRHPTIGDREFREARAHPLGVLARPGYELDPRPLGKVQGPKGLAALVTEAPQHLIYPYETFVESRPKADDGIGRSLEQIRAREGSAEQRLRELRRLRDEGLITEEDYQTTKSQILSEF